jgi:protein-tyrosine phosphatase
MNIKNYNELIQDRVFIGGADDVKDVLKNENVDVILDLRAEVQETDYDRVHSPIFDDGEHQDESIQKSIKHVVSAYNEGKKVYFHCGGGSGRTGTIAVGTLLSLGIAKTIEEAEAMAKEARSKIKVKPEMKDSLKRLFPNA